MTARQLNRAVHLAAATAGIDKRITPHGLRHAFVIILGACAAIVAIGAFLLPDDRVRAPERAVAAAAE